MKTAFRLGMSIDDKLMNEFERRKKNTEIFTEVLIWDEINREMHSQWVTFHKKRKNLQEKLKYKVS